jgi:ankyrin repeat protein
MDIFDAIKENNLHRVEELTKESGFDFNQRHKSFGWIPLFSAYHLKKYDILNYLLNCSGLNINAIDNVSEKSILMNLINDKNIDLIEKVLKIPGLYINQYSNGYTALMLACSKGYRLIVERLLKFPEIDVNIMSYDDNTVLTIACRNIFIKIINRLLEFPGLDINKGYPLKVLIESITKRADFNPEINDIVNKMLQHPEFNYINKVFVIGYNNYRSTLLTDTFILPNIEQMKIIRNNLIAHGADLDMALTIEILQSFPGAVEELIKLGANFIMILPVPINQHIDYIGYDVEENIDEVRYDINLREDDTALTFARRRGNQEIIDIIQRAIERLKISIGDVIHDKANISGAGSVQIILEYLDIPYPIRSRIIGGSNNFYNKLEKYQNKLTQKYTKISDII